MHSRASKRRTYRWGLQWGRKNTWVVLKRVQLKREAGSSVKWRSSPPFLNLRGGEHIRFFSGATSGASDVLAVCIESVLDGRKVLIGEFSVYLATGSICRWFHRGPSFATTGYCRLRPSSLSSETEKKAKRTSDGRL